MAEAAGQPKFLLRYILTIPTVPICNAGAEYLADDPPLSMRIVTKRLTFTSVGFLPNRQQRGFVGCRRCLPCW